MLPGTQTDGVQPDSSKPSKAADKLAKKQEKERLREQKKQEKEQEKVYLLISSTCSWARGRTLLETLMVWPFGVGDVVAPEDGKGVPPKQDC